MNRRAGGMGTQSKDREREREREIERNRSRSKDSHRPFMDCCWSTTCTGTGDILMSYQSVQNDTWCPT